MLRTKKKDFNRQGRKRLGCIHPEVSKTISSDGSSGELGVNIIKQLPGYGRRKKKNYKQRSQRYCTFMFLRCLEAFYLSPLPFVFTDHRYSD